MDEGADKRDDASKLFEDEIAGDGGLADDDVGNNDQQEKKSVKFKTQARIHIYRADEADEEIDEVDSQASSEDSSEDSSDSDSEDEDGKKRKIDEYDYEDADGSPPAWPAAPQEVAYDDSCTPMMHEQTELDASTAEDEGDIVGMLGVTDVYVQGTPEPGIEYPVGYGQAEGEELDTRARKRARRSH